MDLRYEPVSNDVVNFCEEVKNDNFEYLHNATILYVFDNKKKASKGRICIARIKTLNEELKFYAMNNEFGDTFDYAMFIDKQVWNVIKEIDRKRIIYHEFCHCDVNSEKTNVYGLKDHEIQGFYDEAIYNADDKHWHERVSVIAESVHDPENKE